jgi:hypothetical protein
MSLLEMRKKRKGKEGECQLSTATVPSSEHLRVARIMFSHTL